MIRNPSRTRSRVTTWPRRTRERLFEVIVLADWQSQLAGVSWARVTVESLPELLNLLCTSPIPSNASTR